MDNSNARQAAEHIVDSVINPLLKRFEDEQRDPEDGVVGKMYEETVTEVKALIEKYVK